MTDSAPKVIKAKEPQMSPALDDDSDEGDIDAEEMQNQGMRARHASSGGPKIDQTGVAFKKEVITEVLVLLTAGDAPQLRTGHEGVPRHQHECCLA